MALKWTGKSKGALANSANVQPKFTLQRLGQAIGLCTVAGAVGTMAMMPVTAQAMKTDFGMEYRATAFANQTDGFDSATNPNGSDSDTGFANLIRLKGNFLDENTGISVYTSVELAGDRWVGDDHKQGSPVPSYSAGDNTENVRLDLGYVQIPVGHTIFRIGRQAASYNNCFLVCDDRRDRILVIQPLSKSNTIVAGYDRRQDNTAYENIDNGDQAYLGIVSKLGGWNASLLYVKWMNNYDGPLGGGAYALSNVDMFSGYVSGDVGPVKTTVGFNWEADGNVKAPGTDGQVFTDSSYAAYLRLEGNAGPLGLGLQLIGSRDGGLISGGFDTWSSMINNNPDATANASSMYTMGALGADGKLGMKGADQSLIIGKVSYNFTPKFSVTAAVGNLRVDNGDNLDVLSAVSYPAYYIPTTGDDDSMVYDLKFAYKVNKVVNTWLSLGMIEGNDVAHTAGNSLTGQPGVNMTDDVKAASLNMTVDF